MVKEKLKKLISEILDTRGVKIETVPIKQPINSKFGDYASSIALKISKAVGQDAMVLAEEIKNNLIPSEFIEKIDVVKPGFLNFWMRKSFLVDEAQRMDIKSAFEKKNRSILLEYGDPNTHKLPHIGHLFSYIYGESVARILTSVGYTVHGVNYQGDIGLHVAKCLYSLSKKGDVLKECDTLEEKIKFLQQCYQEGSAFYETNDQIRQEIDELNKKIYLKDPSVYPLWEETRQMNLDYYAQLETKLGIHYDRYYFESETALLGKEIVMSHIGSIFEKSDGAIIFKGEEYGLHTRVFINKYGNSTYEAKDMGLIELKKREFAFDLSVVTTASEQNGYWKVVKKATELIYPDLIGKIKHVGFGMINLTSGKMSSRSGRIIDAISLIHLVEEEIKHKFGLEDNELVEKIALASIKYSFLRSDIYQNISFDIEKSISKEGDSGPYLLYTYVRCQSILKQAKITDGVEYPPPNPQEYALLRKLVQFTDVIEEAALSYSPHPIANYLFELTQLYNYFYQKHSVLNAEMKMKELRLMLTQTVATTVKHGLYLLGIETVERM